jgi:hypothetical protein
MYDLYEFVDLFNKKLCYDCHPNFCYCCSSELCSLCLGLDESEHECNGKIIGQICELCGSNICEDCCVGLCSVCGNEDRCFACYGTTIEAQCGCLICIECVIFKNETLKYSEKTNNIICGKCENDDDMPDLSKIDKTKFIIDHKKVQPPIGKYMHWKLNNIGYKGPAFM